ncbi:hypothetical protein ACTI_30730 [Actinoplanes sp. OR16]|uniref:glycosyl hydrolase family 95 catalytic domain-containing protein n=1 Tax=Actinoplanes sp. OR16 TaxID=946334 RepID=UPI000F6C704C|nr:glycoside hydrolase N-terminal domain-containing protein [Actinoplanes sp. OR16]BBH66388.1 hypothetical protein ACTI_30730 [Actinoplanes sp. OR16]
MKIDVNPSFVLDDATEDWEHALITGNGRQGALCYGTPAALRFTLAHEGLFQPITEPLPAPPTATILPRLRELIATSRFAEAAQAVCDVAAAAHAGYEETRWIDPLIPAGTLTFTPAAAGGGYVRGTDFTTGVVRQSWDDVVCDAFVSRVDDVLAVRIRGAGGTVRVGLADGEPERPIDASVVELGDDLVLTGSFPSVEWSGLRGWTLAVRVTRTTEEILILARVSPGLRSAEEALAALPSGRGFDELLAAHAAVHGDLFGRCTLDLGGDPVERLFDAGRYAIISSSGDRPPTLQGVWSGSYSPPWRSGWTVDGNLQAAMLSVHSTGTPSLMTPVFSLISALMEDFRANASDLYDISGFVVPAHLGNHGRQNHFGPVWCLTFWTAGAAWLGRLYVDHWQYTGDAAFLSAVALPYLRSAAAFYLDFVRMIDGRASFNPSYSPENHPSSTGAQACLDATMDRQVVADLLRSLLALDATHPDAPRWRTLLDALPPYRVNEAGELAEWLDPALADNHEHRHCSHFYPFWYAGDPDVDADPALAAAAARAVRSRLHWWLGSASDEMGYGLALVGVAAAHLGLAAESHEALTRLASAYWRPNLVPTHNRDHMFNVDVAGALPALIVAMLLQSEDVTADGPARIRLLPALPPAWRAGSIRGLWARGQIILDISWDAMSLTAILKSRINRRVHLTFPDGTQTTRTLTAATPVSLTHPR